MNQIIKGATDAAPIFCQDTTQVVFHPYDPALSPTFLTNGTGWPTLLACAGAVRAAHTLTKTTASYTTTAAAIGSGKEIHNTHKQWKFQTRNLDQPQTLTVIPCWRPVLKGGNATQRMLSQPETLPQSRPSRRNSSITPWNYKLCTRSMETRLTT